MPILSVRPGQNRIVDDQKVFGIFFLGCFGEVKRTREHEEVVDNHDLFDPFKPNKALSNSLRNIVRFLDP